jgi:hypothetical protein
MIQQPASFIFDPDGPAHATQIEGLLDGLAEAMAHRDLLAAPYQEKIATIQGDMLLDEKLSAAETQIEQLQAAVRQTVLAHGQSVSGSRLLAVYSNGRVSWDSKGLDALVSVYPQIGLFRKQGEPSVTIRIR